MLHHWLDLWSLVLQPLILLSLNALTNPIYSDDAIDGLLYLALRPCGCVIQNFMIVYSQCGLWRSLELELVVRVSTDRYFALGEYRVSMR